MGRRERARGREQQRDRGREQRREQGREQGREQQRDGARGPDPAPLFARALGGSDPAVAELAARWDAGDPVATTVATFVRRAFDAAVALGWTAAEVVRLRAERGGDEGRLVAALVDAEDEVAAVERWRAGCASTVAAVRSAALAVTLLGWLPPAPGGAAAGASGAVAGDDPVLARVRALLAKAESTTFPAEAEALSAKAHELMARHAIDRAALDGGSPGAVGARRIWLDDPYAAAKRQLLAQVAQASGCRTVWSKGLGVVTVFGLPADLDAVEVLHTSLLVQATAAMLAAASGEPGHQTRSRAFRNAFLHAYAGRIGERLRESRQHAVDEATAEHGAGLLPVLASRDAAVDEAMQAAFPELRPGRVSRISDAEGWHAGRHAAGRADLGRQGSVPAGAAAALPG